MSEEAPPPIGSVVLATKYEDGDPGDHWCVGYFSGFTHHGRYHVVNEHGKLFRGNGFRRIRPISIRLAGYLLNHADDIQFATSVWEYVRSLPGETKDLSNLERDQQLGIEYYTEQIAGGLHDAEQ